MAFNFSRSKNVTILFDYKSINAHVDLSNK